MKKYIVSIAHHYHTIEEVVVDANSREEAEEKAIENSDPFGVEPTIDGYSNESEVIDCDEI